MKIEAIKITFKNSNSITINAKYWTDFEISNYFLVIRDEKIIIAMYATDEIFSVELQRTETTVKDPSVKEFREV